jgi:hypothetical protein
MIQLVLTLVIIGVLLYLLNEYVPMDARIKQIIYIVVIICVVIWLLNVFGILAYDVPVPRLR